MLRVQPPRAVTGNAAPSRALCPELYGILMQLFGDVLISSEGEHMYTQGTRVRNGRLEPIIVYAGEYYRVRCPFCRDQRHRLWINYQYGQIGPDGRPMFYLAHCYNENCLARPGNTSQLADRIYGFRNVNARGQAMALAMPEGEPEGPLTEAPWPGATTAIHDLPAGHPAVQYIVGQRRFTLQTLDQYSIRFCHAASPDYRTAQDRLIFPINMGQKLVGWQGRYVGDIDWKATGIPKYYSLPRMKKGQMLFNLDRAQFSPFVVVVEGPTDVLALGDIAVATLGKGVSYRQRQLLLHHWHNKPIILLFDPGEKVAIQESRDRLLSDCPTAMVIDLYLPEGGVDPGAMPRETARGFVYNSVFQRTGIRLPAAA